MRIETLPSPGALSMGLRLRTEAAKAISHVEIMADLSGGKVDTANSLHAFFTACATAVASLRDLTVPTFVRAFGNKSTPSTIVFEVSEGLDPSAVPPVTAFTVAGPSRTVTAVAISGKTAVLTLSAALLPADVPTVAYAGTVLQDTAGNKLAAVPATAITRPA